MRLAVGACLVFVTQACFPPDLDVIGKRCDEERGCGPGLECIDERCAVPGPAEPLDGGPFPAGLNLLRNGGFERALADGGIADWSSANGTRAVSTAARTGARAARLRGLASPDPVQLTSELVPGVTDGLDFCARAFGRNDFDAGAQLVLSIRERQRDGTTTNFPRTVNLPPRSRWTPVTTTYRANGGTGVQVRVSSNVKSDAGLLVDDVELFRAPGTGCEFP
jgi:hypothetical protein